MEFVPLHGELFAGIAAAAGILFCDRIRSTDVLSLVTCAVLCGIALVTPPSQPLLWALALAAAVCVAVVTWLAARPDARSLSAARTLGFALCCLVAGAILAPPFNSLDVVRSSLACGLVLVAIMGCVALVPFGGWAVALTSGMRSSLTGAWTALLLPTLLFSLPQLLPLLWTLPSRPLFVNAGINVCTLSAVYGSVASLRVHGRARYTRLFITDMAIATAGFVALTPDGLVGGSLVVLTHLLIGPRFFATRPLSDAWPLRVGWMLLSGLPFTPAFWGRFFVMQALAPTSTWAFLLVIGAAGLLFFTAMGGFFVAVHRSIHPSSRIVGAVSWCMIATAAITGLAPGQVSHIVFGMSIS